MANLAIDPMVPHQYRIDRTQRETRDTFTLTLSPVNGSPCLTFRPGQFMMLYVFGIGEVPISVSGPPYDNAKLIHTIRAVGAATRGLQALKRGEVVGVRGPFGSHWPVAEAAGNDVLLVAGGLGLAPLRPALYAVLADRDQYGTVSLLYGARTPQDLLYAKELEQWRGRFDLTVEATVDSAGPHWHGHVGVVTKLIARAQYDPSDTTAFICGPEIMMRFVIAELRRRHIPTANLHLSLERNMKCAIGFCGHCQFGPTFLCKDGPVFRYDRIEQWLGKREI
ncbi:MAG: FAD/NAD(P)-binding protein [Candidatus Binatia bacterium]